MPELLVRRVENAFGHAASNWRSARQRLGIEALESRHLLTALGPESPSERLVSFPDDLQGTPDQIIVAPVDIDDAGGMRAAEIHFRYDTDLLDADNAGIRAGSVWPDTNAFVHANVDDAAGTIAVWVFGIEALPPGAGSLVEIDFTIRPAACDGVSDSTIETQLVIDQVILDEGAIPATTASGTITTFCDPPPTDPASISGYVYAVNSDPRFQPPRLGLPGVSVALVRVDDSGTAPAYEAQTTTDASGRYEFVGLVAGTYRITETSPPETIDEVVHELLVDVATNEASTGNDFAEAWFRPELISVNMFLASTVIGKTPEEVWRNGIYAGTTLSSAAAAPLATPTPAQASETAAAIQSLDASLAFATADDAATEESGPVAMAASLDTRIDAPQATAASLATRIDSAFEHDPTAQLAARDTVLATTELQAKPQPATDAGIRSPRYRSRAVLRSLSRSGTVDSLAADAVLTRTISRRRR